MVREGRHDRRGWDEADEFQTLLRLLRSFKPLNFKRILVAADKVAAFKGQGDRYAAGAAEDFRRLAQHPDGKDIYYVMYGHTHLAKQVPIAVVGDPPHERYRVYLNTGTWRPTHRMLLGRDGFASWKEITYALLYRPGELVSGGIRWSTRRSSPGPAPSPSAAVAARPSTSRSRRSSARP